MSDDKWFEVLTQLGGQVAPMQVKAIDERDARHSVEDMYRNARVLEVREVTSE